MTDLNENHKKYLQTTFSHVDKFLSEFECIIDVLIPRAPFQPYINDVNPELRKIIEKHSDLIRKTMSRILKKQGILPSKPDRSVLNSIRTTLIFVDIALEELRPKYMKGYGKLSNEAGNELDALATELQTLVRKIKSSIPELFSEHEMYYVL
jgi:hypothetical protein